MAERRHRVMPKEKNQKKLYDFFYNLYIIPISSRERESFSQRNFIVSTLISFLLIKTISSVMFICFIGPSLSQFNPKKFCWFKQSSLASFKSIQSKKIFLHLNKNENVVIYSLIYVYYHVMKHIYDLTPF